MWSDGLTICDVTNARDDSNERAPPHLHPTELPERHVEAVGAALDLDKGALILGGEARREGAANLFGAGGGEARGGHRLKVGVGLALVV